MQKPQTIQVTRLENCRQLIAESGGIASFGKRIGRTNDNGQLSNTFGPSAKKNIGDVIARHIEERFSKDPGWLDIPWAWLNRQSAEVSELHAEFDTQAVEITLASLVHALTLSIRGAGAEFAKHLQDQAKDSKPVPLSVTKGLLAKVLGIVEEAQSTPATVVPLSSRPGSVRKPK